MSDFVGLAVLVTLTDGQVVEGRIEAVAPEANLMLLSDAGTSSGTRWNGVLISLAVVARANLGSRQGTGYARLEVGGDQVTSIDILEGAPQAKEREFTPSHPVPPPQGPSALDLLMGESSRTAPHPKEKSGDAAGGKSSMPPKRSNSPKAPSMAPLSGPASSTPLAVPKILSRKDKPAALSIAPPSPPSLVSLNLNPPTSLSETLPAKGRSPPRSSLQKRASGFTDWSGADAKSIRRAEDFDFQANLGLFDKERVFREIRASDSVLPEERLVAHNRKLRHDEMILERVPKGGDDTVTMMAKAAAAASKDMEAPQPEESLAGKAQRGTTPAPPIIVPNVPTLDRTTVEAIEQQLVISGALTIEQLIENCGRSLAEFLYQRAATVLGIGQGPNGRQSSDGPSILLHLSADRRGAYALAAGRTLLNRGLSVCAFISGTGAQQRAPPYFSQALRSFQTFGGAVVDAVPKLVALLIAAVPAFTLPVRAQATCSLVGASHEGVSWVVDFGLPSSSPSAASPVHRKQCPARILCDAGWPAAMVNRDPRADLDDLAYEDIFGMSSFVHL